MIKTYKNYFLLAHIYSYIYIYIYRVHPVMLDQKRRPESPPALLRMPYVGMHWRNLRGGGANAPSPIFFCLRKFFVATELK
jgi:hypothetical protein